MMPIRYLRAQLAKQLNQAHPGHREFIRERLRAFDEHRGHDKMIPVTHRKLKPLSRPRRVPLVPYDRTPITSG